MPEFTSPRVEEFYNKSHDPASGRFSGRAAGRAGAGNSQTKIPQGPQHGNRGGPHVTAKDRLPLRNATTGRINPLPVRHAFKQGLKEIIGKKQDSKRTTLTPAKTEHRENAAATSRSLPSGRNVYSRVTTPKKVNTVKTYKGRRISHVSSKGGPTPGPQGVKYYDFRKLKG